MLQKIQRNLCKKTQECSRVWRENCSVHSLFCFSKNVPPKQYNNYPIYRWALNSRANYIQRVHFIHSTTWAWAVINRNTSSVHVTRGIPLIKVTCFIGIGSTHNSLLLGAKLLTVGLTKSANHTLFNILMITNLRRRNISTIYSLGYLLSLKT